MMHGTSPMSYHNPPPEKIIDETDIVVPNSLQMGWRESPAYFCAASETARDISDERARTKIGILPEHFLEEPKTTTISKSLPSKPSMLKLAQWVIKVYVDNFIGMAQNP